MMDGVGDPAASVEAAAETGREVRPSFLALALGSVGVVFGDIGTSPLYAFREAASVASENHPVTRGIVLGVLSLILWALIITVTAKYVLILLRAVRSRSPRSPPARSAAEPPSCSSSASSAPRCSSATA
jgi:hypothetical protein